MADLGVRTLVYTDIARDGMLGEPDIDGALELARGSGCQVVVSGASPGSSSWLAWLAIPSGGAWTASSWARRCTKAASPSPGPWKR